MLTSTSNRNSNKDGIAGIVRHSRGIEDAPKLDPDRKKALTAFQKAVGIRFKSLDLLNLSFIHRSVSNESSSKINNERLEFLGDAILGAITAGILYEKLKDKSEGDLAKIKSVVVSEDILSALALVLQLDTLLLLGRGEELSGGRNKRAILADAMEALIGAYYLDSGYKPVFNFVSRYISPEINRVLEKRYYMDYKSILQELSQRLYHSYPVYRLTKRTGPEHERYFWIEVTVEGNVYGPGMGRSKKAAEQEAARAACEAINGLPSAP
jgi:ribonuclease-3